MNTLLITLYLAIILGILMLPVYFAGINSKDKEHMGYVRIASWYFGWTGVGWIIAMLLAFMPNPPEV